MAGNRQNSTMFWGFILVLLGLLFLLDNFYFIDFWVVVSRFWPVLLILIGVKILLDKKRAKDAVEEIKEDLPAGTTTSGNLSESNIFGDVRLKITDDNFTGGTVNNVFGDIKIDLSDAKLSSDTLNLSINNVFGDITVVPPKEVALRVNASAVIGDITARAEVREGFFPKIDYKDSNYNTAGVKMAVQISVVFGSITVF